MTRIQPTTPLCLREKLLTHGVESLADTELLAVFVSSGNAKKTCLQLASDLLTHLGDLRAVINADRQCFNQISGLEPVRFMQLQAVREICRRSDFINLQRNIQITNSQEAYVYLKRQLRDKKNETFAALFLDNQHRVLVYKELFTGTINSATIFIRPIINCILQVNAAAIILAHNHPSGLTNPSQHDLTVTKRLKQAFNLIDVRLIDHLIIGDNEVYSILNQLSWPCH